MATIDTLKSPSWRGIPFIYKGETLLDGFKGQVFEFPGSDNAQFKQQGLIGKVININLEIRETDLDGFTAAINTPGNGLLVHPRHGPLSAKIMQTNRAHSIERLEIYEFTVPFFIERGIVTPSVQGITSAVISRFRSVLVTSATVFSKERLKRLGF